MENKMFEGKRQKLEKFRKIKILSKILGILAIF
jgi:hypothetical protein